ncbi:hypothetical protein JCM6882_001242 [Rhodosporidiobolus microsporus]
MPISTTPELPAGSPPISDTIGLINGAAEIPLALSSSGDLRLVEADILKQLEDLKKKALDRLQEEAKKQKASGVIEMGLVLKVEAQGVGVLTVDTL